jgi:5-amino-6-(5-phospho-D-ribitylamino)uracil phosphatase
LATLPRSPYKLLALDVDGTLLNHEGLFRPRTAESLARAAREGLHPVLCTGRRYRRALPVALELGLRAPVVCNSGALVKDPQNHGTLWRADFDRDLLGEILSLFEGASQPVVSFTDRDPADFDFVVAAAPTGQPWFDEFVSLNRPHAEIDPLWPSKLNGSAHFHLCALGTRHEMIEFETMLRRQLTGRIQTFVQKSPRYAGTMCEVLRSDASKWSAILHLAEGWGIDASEICAVGDDMNDIPMIQGAGLGVAMGHAPPVVQAAADRVIPDLDHDGLALLIDELLS